MYKTAAVILRKIDELKTDRERVIVAIDGRCGSGKTTLASILQERLSCNLLHMDDFYLRPEQRTPERYLEAGGNVDYERFLSEALIPLREGRPFEYRPFDCRTMELGDPMAVNTGCVELVEGSYSCHPSLYPYYDLRIFLTVGSDEQMMRILKRNGEEKAKEFRDRWIPLEELYFSNVPVEENCDLRFDTSGLTLPEFIRRHDQ